MEIFALVKHSRAYKFLFFMRLGLALGLELGKASKHFRRISIRRKSKKKKIQIKICEVF